MVGIWRQIVVGGYPTLHPRAHLVLQLRGRRTELGDHEMTVRLFDPAGTLLMEQTGTMQVNEPPAGVIDLDAPVILVFDVPLSTPGDYLFRIDLDGVEAAQVPFTAGLSTQN